MVTGDDKDFSFLPTGKNADGEDAADKLIIGPGRAMLGLNVALHEIQPAITSGPHDVVK